MTNDLPMVRRSQPWLGTFVEIGVDRGAAAAIDAGFAIIAHLHDRMSFHSHDSDLAHLRRLRAGGVREIDPHSHAVLAMAGDLFRTSGGLFDVTVAGTLVRDGFLPKLDPGDPAAYPGGAGDIELLEDCRVRLARPTLIDLGGIAKGYAVDRAVETLREAGARHGIVNAGGDLRVFGDHAITIQVRQRDGRLGPPLTLQDRAIASSENVRSRRWRWGRMRTPHIGRGGKPVIVDQPLSIIADSCMVADAMTKVAIIDPDAAQVILDGLGGCIVGRPLLAAA